MIRPHNRWLHFRRDWLATGDVFVRIVRPKRLWAHRNTHCNPRPTFKETKVGYQRTCEQRFVMDMEHR